MFKIIIFTLCLATMSCFAAPLPPVLKPATHFQLSQSLQNAEAGDYLVTAAGKSFTLFHIIESQEKRLVIEEISASMGQLKQVKTNWQEWINCHAPGHESWVIYELDLQSKQIEEMYSFSQQNWQKVYSDEHLFPKLIELSFALLPESDRKKTGPKPPENVPDKRPLWNPPIYFEGKKLNQHFCHVYQAKWPDDGSELSNKKIEIYLPEGKNSPIINYFPFWMQASNDFAKAKLRVVDSGKQLQSIHSQLPTPPLELISQQFDRSKSIIFDLKTHPKHNECQVFFRNVEGGPCFQIPVETKVNDSKRKLRLIVKNQDLKNNLNRGKMYYFIFEPKEQPLLSTATPKPINIP